ncbi:outer membrane lipoprotein involved in outer membrane biogenesis [Herbaspirillum sp. YR522]|nr:outer membrane lipoprotein involved in outer membrane biogenesis [Herbaspirillum sp. YR522]
MNATSMTSRWRPLAATGALALSALVVGCASLSPPAAPGAQAAAPYLESIAIDGRISVQYAQNDQPQSLHGSFNWSQSPGRTGLDLLSPLGQTVATIDVRPGVATLVQSGRAPQVAPDVDQLAARALGWPLPVAGMRHWLQGRGTDSSGKPFQAVPGDENASFVTADGWRVAYPAWQAAADGDSLRPRRIDLTRNTEQAGPVSIRIVVDSWKKP